MHRLVVLNAADGERELALAEGRQLLVLEPRPGRDAHVRLAAASESGPDCRAEVRLQDGRLLVYNLNPFQSLSVNGMSPSFEDGAAVLEPGDVLTVDEVSLRFLAPGRNRGGPGRQSGSFITLTATSDDLELGPMDAEPGPAAAEDLDRARRRLRCLEAIGRGALLEDDPKLLIKTTLEGLLKGMPEGTTGSVMWRIAAGGAWKRVARVPDDAAPVQQSVIRHVGRTPVPLLRREASGSGPDAEAVRSLVCVPVLRATGVSGLVHLAHPEPARLDEIDLATASSAAGLLAAGLDAIDARREQKAASIQQATRLGRGLEHARDVTRLETGDAGVTFEAVSVAFRYVDRGESTGAFGEALHVPLPGSPSRVLVGLGELRGPYPLVDAARAVAAIRALAPHRLPPATMVSEVSRVLAVAGIAPAGTAMLASADPADERVLLVATGHPIVIRIEAASGRVAPVEVQTTSEGLQETGDALAVRPTAVPLAAGDVVVLVAGGFASASARMVAGFCETLAGATDLPAAMATMASRLEKRVVEGRCAAIAGIRRDA